MYDIEARVASSINKSENQLGLTTKFSRQRLESYSFSLFTSWFGYMTYEWVTSSMEDK